MDLSVAKRMVATMAVASVVEWVVSMELSKVDYWVDEMVCKSVALSAPITVEQ